MLLAAIDLDEYIQILESDESLQEDSCIFAAAAGGSPHTYSAWGTIHSQARGQTEDRECEQRGTAAELELSGVMPVVKVDTWPRTMLARPKGRNANSATKWATGNGSALRLSGQNSLQIHI